MQGHEHRITVTDDFVPKRMRPYRVPEAVKPKVERPITFASQKLSGSQLGSAIIEKEAYAIIWVLNRFREIVYGSHITVMCITICCSIFESVLPKVPSCCVGPCLYRNMMSILRIPEVLRMWWLITCHVKEVY